MTLLLKEIVEKIREVSNDEFYENEDQYYHAGIDEGLNRAVEIITEYCYTMMD